MLRENQVERLKDTDHSGLIEIAWGGAVISTDLTQGRDRRRDDVNTELKFEFFKV
jgi:hypothetical protein